MLAIFGGHAILGVMEITFFSSSATFFEAQKVAVSECHLAAQTANPGKQGTQDPELQQVHRRLFGQRGT
jgi:hypothetical protein